MSHEKPPDHDPHAEPPEEDRWPRWVRTTAFLAPIAALAVAVADIIVQLLTAS